MPTPQTLGPTLHLEVPVSVPLQHSCSKRRWWQSFKTPGVCCRYPMFNIIMVYPWESPLQQQELEVGDTVCVYFSTERLSMTPWTTTERGRVILHSIPSAVPTPLSWLLNHFHVASTALCHSLTRVVVLLMPQLSIFFSRLRLDTLYNTLILIVWL